MGVGRLSAIFNRENVKLFFSKLGGLLSRAICIVDDIPLLLLKDTGLIGPFLLAGAGFVIFPVQGVIAIFELVEAFDKRAKDQDHIKFRAKLSASITKLGLAILGLLISSALLAFILVHLVILQAVASVAIPLIMTVISGVELMDAFGDLRRAKLAAKLNPSPENHEKVDDAKRDVAFNSTYLGLGLAITGLATLGVLTGLGVLTFGFVPAAVLISVVVIALAVKIFEIVDEKKGHRMTNAIKNTWRKIFSHDKPGIQQRAGYQPLLSDMPDMEQTLNNNPPLARAGTAIQPAPENPVEESPRTPTTPGATRSAPDTPDTPQNLNNSFSLG